MSSTGAKTAAASECRQLKDLKGNERANVKCVCGKDNNKKKVVKRKLCEMVKAR